MSRRAVSNRFSLFLVAVLAVLTACSTGGGKAKYEKHGSNSGKPLEVPPGLELPKNNETLSVPIVSGRNEQARTPVIDQRLLPPTPQGRLVQEGGIRYLVVNQPPEKVWREAQGYFRNLGFKIEYQDPKIGVFQTDWQENRVYNPSNWFTKLLNKVTSSGLMDKYRVRVERIEGEPNQTRLYITHQGLEEVAINEDYPTEVVETRWQPRASDPELEAEMMLRFLVFIGMSEEQARQAMAEARAEPRAEIRETDGVPLLLVKENFARTWRRVGLALDRLGLIVDDRDRSKGVYFVRLGEDFIAHRIEKQGFFDRLFKGEKDVTDKRYLIRVDGRGEVTVVTPHDGEGKPEKGEIGKLLIKLLYDQLR